MPIIHSISDLKRHTEKILAICDRNSEPVYLTRKGKDKAVIMSRACFNRQLALADLYEKLDEAEKDIKKNPKGIPHTEVIKRLRKIVR